MLGCSCASSTFRARLRHVSIGTERYRELAEFENRSDKVRVVERALLNPKWNWTPTRLSQKPSAFCYGKRFPKL